MKRFLLLLISLLPLFYARAESYRVFNASTQVEIRSGEVWTPAKKRMALRLLDWVRIPEGGSLSILEESTRRIYVSVECGEYRVAQLILSAKKRADKLISDVNRQIIKAMEQQQESEYSYSTAGVSHRGTSCRDYEQSIYATLDALDMEGICPGNTTAQLCLDIRQNEDGSGCFIMTNKTDRALYVNILYRDSVTGKDQLCIPVGYSGNDPCLILAPQTIRDMTEYVFDIEEMKGSLLLFGVDDPFDVQKLQLLMNEHSAIDTQPVNEITYSNLLKL